MSPTRHFDPTPGSQILLPEDHHGHQGDDRRNIEPVHPIQQLLIVDQADQKHAHHPAHDPVNLPDMRSGKFGVHSGAVNLHHPQPANQQDKDEEHPVKIAK